MATDFLQHAGGDAASFDNFPFLGFDAVIVGLGRKRDGAFKTYVDLVVGEFERLEMAELGAEMLGQIIGVAALDAAVLEDLRIAREQRCRSLGVQPFDGRLILG